MIAYGDKTEIEQLEYDLHKWHGSFESNYQCWHWAEILQHINNKNEWGIDLDQYDIDNYPEDWGKIKFDKKDKGKWLPENPDENILSIKKTKDKRYIIQDAENEDDIMIEREKDGKPKY